MMSTAPEMLIVLCLQLLEESRLFPEQPYTLFPDRGECEVHAPHES